MEKQTWLNHILSNQLAWNTSGNRFQMKVIRKRFFFFNFKDRKSELWKLMTGVLICAEQSDWERTHDTDTGNNSLVRHHDSQSVSACTVQQMSVVTQSSVTKHHKYQQTPPPLLQWQLAGLLETYTARVFLRCWIFFHSKEGVQKLPALYLEFLKPPGTGKSH